MAHLGSGKVLPASVNPIQSVENLVASRDFDALDSTSRVQENVLLKK